MMKVLIKRSYSDAENVNPINIDEICGVKWDNISGGIHKRQNGYSLYGYILYERAVELVNCSDRHREYNGYAKVMIPESINREKEYREGYNELKKRAKNKKPCGEIKKNRPEGYGPCTKYILGVLEETPVMKMDELKNQARKYLRKTVNRAIRSLDEQGKIRIVIDNNYKVIQKV